MSTKTTPAKAPENHPNVNRWWNALRRQSWFCLYTMAAEIPFLFIYGVDEHTAMPLVVINLGLLGGVAAYGGGCTFVDMVKAYRGNA